MAKRPRLSFWQIWNLSFGFLGVQAGFALQNANVSRILSNYGADLHHLSFFWLVAPIMGLIIQPWVGAASDRTWTRMGRRKPFIFGGAIAAAIGMFFMPNSHVAMAILSPIIFGAIMLALMDASFNVTFQPFRSLVADMTPEEQTNTGYSVQTVLINIGAVIGSFLPFILTQWLGVGNTAPDGQVPPSVVWSFYIGGLLLLLSVLWTVFTTKEYSPEEFKMYNQSALSSEQKTSFWQTLKTMPPIMGKLAIVQFFSWFALFAMWVYTTPAVAQHIWKTPIGDSVSPDYNAAANWVGVLFGLYSVFAAIFAIFLDKIANKLGRVKTYSISLLLGGLGYLSMYVFSSPNALIISMAGIGIAWASILAMPYAILARSLPADRMGIYMGIFNITVVVPQIVSGILLGIILKLLFQEQAIYMIVLAGVSMLLASASAILYVSEKHQNA